MYSQYMGGLKWKLCHKKSRVLASARMPPLVDNHIRSRLTGSDSLGGGLNSYSSIYKIEMYIYKKSRQAKKKLAWLSFSSKDPTSKQACLTGRLWQSGADGTQIGYKFLFIACWFRTVQLSLPFGEWLSWTTLVSSWQVCNYENGLTIHSTCK